MQVKHTATVPANDVTMEGSAGCRVRWLIGEGDKAPNFAMREFEVAPGGHTPKHFHDYEHEVYVLAGRGIVIDGDKERPLAAGRCRFRRPERRAPIPQHGQRADAVPVPDPQLGHGKECDRGAGVRLGTQLRLGFHHLRPLNCRVAKLPTTVAMLAARAVTRYRRQASLGRDNQRSFLVWRQT